MMNRLLTTLCLAGALTTNTFAAGPTHPKSPTDIRLLVASQRGALIETRGAYRITDPVRGETIASTHRGERLWIEARADGIRIGDQLLPKRQVVFIPQDKSTKTSLLIDGIQYTGVLAVYAQKTDDSDTLYCVNEVDLETYTSSVLSDQIDHRVQPEALHALAIIERSRAAYLAANGIGQNWHAHAADVGYKGFGVTEKKLGIELAAKATRSFVMQARAVGAPAYGFDARWTAHSAGELAPLSTLTEAAGFDASIYTGSALAKKDREASAWNYEINARALARALDMETIAEVRLSREPKSGRIQSVEVEDVTKQKKKLSFSAFQQIFGKEFIRSNRFEIASKTPRSIRLEGVGSGLGTGLCLYTAEQMSRLGQDAKEILATFFPGATVKKIDAITQEQLEKLELMQQAKQQAAQKAAHNKALQAAAAEKTAQMSAEAQEIAD